MVVQINHEIVDIKFDEEVESSVLEDSLNGVADKRVYKIFRLSIFVSIVMVFTQCVCEEKSTRCWSVSR